MRVRKQNAPTWNNPPPIRFGQLPFPVHESGDLTGQPELVAVCS